MNKRFRRLRNNKVIRNLVRETTLSKDDFVMPFFVVEGEDVKEAIESMPGIYRTSIDLLVKDVQAYVEAGGQAGGEERQEERGCDRGSNSLFDVRPFSIAEPWRIGCCGFEWVGGLGRRIGSP